MNFEAAPILPPLCKYSRVSGTSNKPMGFTHFSCQVQAQSGTGILRGIKGFKKFWQLVFFDARSLVDNIELWQLVRLLEIGAHNQGWATGSLGTIAQSIIEQIGQYLFELRAIKGYVDRLLIAAKGDVGSLGCLIAVLLNKLG